MVNKWKIVRHGYRNTETKQSIHSITSASSLSYTTLQRLYLLDPHIVV